MTNTADGKKVLVLMSGGVDSSTTAALLVKQGYDVSGAYLKLWEGNFSRREIKNQKSKIKNNLAVVQFSNDTLGDPCWAQEMRDAARVAAQLGISFEVWDVTEDYKKRVLKNFYSEYAAGRTPNPDVLCNSEIKFGVALERALSRGYDYVATGHYARLRREFPITNNQLPNKFKNQNKKLEIGNWKLEIARDAQKDQSYFLWRLTQEQLSQVLFPIGDYTKPQVRELAKKFGLHNAEKKDSQGVCFLGKIELKEFLRPGVAEKSGSIYDVRGNLLGFHDGLTHFTIGQRQGTRLGGTGPYYVVGKNAKENILVVAHENDEAEYRAVGCTISNVQFHNSYFMTHNSFTCMARIRYRAPLVSVILTPPEWGKDPERNSTGFFATLRFAQNDSSEWRVHFKEPQRAVAPGQSIVFYDGERVIGGGVIDKVTLQSVPQISNIQYPISNKISNAQILQL